MPDTSLRCPFRASCGLQNTRATLCIQGQVNTKTNSRLFVSSPPFCIHCNLHIKLLAYARIKDSPSIPHHQQSLLILRHVLTSLLLYWLSSINSILRLPLYMLLNCSLSYGAFSQDLFYGWKQRRRTTAAQIFVLFV